MTLTGTNFVGNSVVDFNGVAQPTAFVNATTLTATAGSFTSIAIPLTVLPIPSGTYYITITGPVSFSGKVQF